MTRARGFTDAGLGRLHDVLAGHVRDGRLPGAVLALSRGGHDHIDAVGSMTPGGAPVGPGALFRITSMTRPVTAVAALRLIAGGRLSLADPIERWLPELAGRPVLRRLDGPLDDTVAARRPVTVEDLLTFRSGFGMILAPPQEYPILAAEQALELCSAGPPVPATPHEPGEWLRRMGTLPLMDQPGEQWRYCTSSMVLGVLVARVADQPLADYCREQIFGPLGMADTGFWVRPGQRDRLVPCYQAGEQGLEPFDDGGHWTRPPAFPDGGAGLVGTVGDYLAFARMLAAGGQPVLPAGLAAAMTTSQLTQAQRDSAGPILDGRGWGYGLSIIDPPVAGPGPAGYGWSGGFGTTWVTDPGAGLIGILFTQVLAMPGSGGAEADFWAAAYAALDRG